MSLLVKVKLLTGLTLTSVILPVVFLFLLLVEMLMVFAGWGVRSGGGRRLPRFETSGFDRVKSSNKTNFDELGEKLHSPREINWETLPFSSKNPLGSKEWRRISGDPLKSSGEDGPVSL